jgi:hypothetical protein
LQFRDHDVAAIPEPGIHHTDAILDESTVGQYLADRCPVVSLVVREVAVLCSCCCVFESRRLRLQFIKAGERGVQVCLVEDLAAVDQVTFERQNVDPSPLGVQALS